MRYGSILTNIGMNRLISVLSTLHYLVTSALFVVIGLIMFLIPVVPGPVVYLTSGVLLVPTMEAANAVLPTYVTMCMYFGGLFLLFLGGLLF